MSDIEKDIKRCEKLTEPQNENWIGISNQMAIASALARIKELEEEKKTICEEYCPKTERIKELEAKLEFKKWGDLDNVQFEEYMNQLVPKEKIKESYLKMEKEYARKVYDDNYNRNEVKKEEFYKRQVYEELLEDK